MKNKFIITIGRQYGSGGRKIGILLAEMLGIEFYDRKLITEAAKRSGLSNEVFETKDERTLDTLAYALSTGVGFYNMFSQESLFKIQSDTILEIAEKGPCVIVGRCADYVLRDNPSCINIFIHAPKEVRIERIMNRTETNRKEAIQLIEKTDKNREAYYDFYTNKTWSAAASYDLSVDSSLLGLEETAKYILEFVNRSQTNGSN